MNNYQDKLNFFKQYDSIREFLQDNFELEQLGAIQSGGCSRGVPHLSYFYETAALYDTFTGEVWAIVGDTATDQGEESILRYLARSEAEIVDEATFKNLMAWLAVESIVYKLVNADYCERNGIDIKNDD